ncbi:MAG: hypothetical protein ABJL99_17565 [Aliishimia sp.]
MSADNIFLLLAGGIPFLSFAVCLWFGARITLISIALIAVAFFLAPFVYFGIWSLKDGVPLGQTLQQVSVITAPLLIILGVTILWSCLAVAAAIVLRFAFNWVMSRRRDA